MSKPSAPPFSEPPPYAPPSYSQAVGGVPPQAPFTPMQAGAVPMAPLYVPPQRVEVQGVQYGAQVTSTAYPPFGNAAPTAIVTTVVPLGSQSTHMICPHCHSEIDTATKTSPSVVAWLSGCIICILGCWLGCCLIPCCINECMNVEHNCPNCQAFLGKYKRG
ncbi:lipopolysaccharide-induced tumor necrosis factor-alpha factor homolog isoform X3 [Penaeus japonicus]|nr:lipopolysaccharide-induced tumor necrosis factor-alpha factor homolog [Penaeus vannamei]XP_027208629.1 lipopolysaccharide-induced tumor necrosis factor-alpha factor homolog [Penaeus vannamei]XP_042885768.1 lipopolysaccharide-induced tumor necrosis factor-alpha factor homolog isoform X3 [Penaeus japonicus]XP_042885779.1 lipopolysaccharide-induced tumor necrosis factor-alpha factor homolog isoform X3 [Penaeus japonicus]